MGAVAAPDLASLAGSLKPVITRVREHDGTLRAERRCEDGSVLQIDGLWSGDDPGGPERQRRTAAERAARQESVPELRSANARWREAYTTAPGGPAAPRASRVQWAVALVRAVHQMPADEDEEDEDAADGRRTAEPCVDPSYRSS